MTTAKTKSASQDCSTLPTDAFKRYIDVLLDSHDKFTSAVKGARSRSARLNDELLDSVVTGQRHALEFGKKIAENPTDVAGNMKAAIEFASTAQARAVEFARFLVREQAGIGQEIRENLGSVFDTSKVFGKGFGFSGFNAPWFKPAAQ